MLKTLAMYKHCSLMKNIKKFHITDIDTLGQWYKTFSLSLTNGPNNARVLNLSLHPSLINVLRVRLVLPSWAGSWPYRKYGTSLEMLARDNKHSKFICTTRKLQIKKFKHIDKWEPCYKTFYVRNLLMFILS